MKYMIKIKEYVMAESLEQAYELNQKKRNCVIGGMLWLKMGSRMVPTAIDLSNLGLNTIEENEEEFLKRPGVIEVMQDFSFAKEL